MSSLRLAGVFVANATPFSRAGDYLPEVYHDHLVFLAASGVNGFVPCGTTGESATLTREERRLILETTCEFAHSRGLKVVAGCGGNNTLAAADLITEAKAIGCDAALVVTPYYNRPTQSGLCAHYRYLAEKGGLPIVLYNVPARTGVNLEVETVKALFEHPEIVGVKEASGRYANWLALSTELDLSKKSLLSGDDDALPIIMALGGCGIISASANVVPQFFVAMHGLIKEGRWEKAFALQKRIYPLLRALFLETNPTPLKYALELMGHGEAHFRLPLVPVSSATEIAVTNALKDLDLLP